MIQTDSVMAWLYLRLILCVSLDLSPVVAALSAHFYLKTVYQKVPTCKLNSNFSLGNIK